MTTTQLEDQDVAKPNDATAAGMIAWLNWTIEKNELPDASASALRTGCQKVLEVEDDLEHLDIRTLDIDAILTRFRNKHRGTQMKDSTMDAYTKRLRQTVDMYTKWLDGDPAWRPSSRTRSSAGTTSRRVESKGQHSAKEAVPTTPPEVETGTNMIRYPFPIRPGLQGSILLPEDLTTKEAKRISNFVASLAFEDEPATHVPLAITNGRNSDA